MKKAADKQNAMKQSRMKIIADYSGDDGFMNISGGEENEEDQEEMEAFIKKRVKAGTGRDYDTIVKKDVVNYQRVKGEHDNEFQDITKFENSKDYKKMKDMMEVQEEDFMVHID